jgi:TetR/AcrR family transcriptional repressor of nem operon
MRRGPGARSRRWRQRWRGIPARHDTRSRPVEPSLDVLAERLSRRRGKEAGRADAAAFLGLLVSTLQLARVTPDRAESGAILEAGVRAALRLAKGDG